jgi:hypothetical protein
MRAPARVPRLFIDEFVGISNRLETLPLAFAIRRAHGHDIVLDWQELDSFSVAETARGSVGVFAKLGALRVRNCDRALFDTLGNRKIILRSLEGPPELLDPIYLDVARKVRLAPALARDITTTFARVRGRPVVGVHIRHGDYRLDDEAVYRVDREWPAVPVWWYALMMAAIRRVQPEVVFFLSGTGDPRLLKELQDFETFSLNVSSQYDYKGADHGSKVNPVADLFALACCPVILATPLSGYSHWAANALGPPSQCIIPLPGATREHPRPALVSIYGARLPRWRATARSGADSVPLGGRFSGLNLGSPADTEWL